MKHAPAVLLTLNFLRPHQKAYIILKFSYVS